MLEQAVAAIREESLLSRVDETGATIMSRLAKLELNCLEILEWGSFGDFKIPVDLVLPSKLRCGCTFEVFVH